MNITKHDVYGVVVDHRTSDDYINATALALAYQRASGKRRDVSEWLSNKRTEESLQHLSAKTGIPVNQLYQVFRGSPENGGGTWLHPRLAVRFGMWLSDEFGYMVEEWFAQKVEQAQPRPMTQLEIIATLAQQMVEQERLLRVHQEQLNTLLTIQREAREELAALPYSDKPAPEKSTRMKVNELVRDYCYRNNVSHREVWVKLYREFRVRCHVDATIRAKNQGKLAMDVVDELGLIDELHAIATLLLK
jgi:KilA-N domain